jgi:hypothetical protein
MPSPVLELYLSLSWRSWGSEPFANRSMPPKIEREDRSVSLLQQNASSLLRGGKNADYWYVDELGQGRWSDIDPEDSIL